jgi:ubiquinone/menaquinone biosynthesis C-methylase UbiE
VVQTNKSEDYLSDRLSEVSSERSVGGLNTEARTTSVPPQAILLDYLCGMMRTQAIHHASRLRIAELVEDGPKSVSALAEATKTHASSLARLLRALASIGIFTEVEPEYFAQTPLSVLLQPDVPGSMYHVALLHGDHWQWHVWEGFAHTLQTGEPTFSRLFGVEMFQYFTQHSPESAKVFNDAMTGFSEQVNMPIATANYDFSSLDTLVDIGGGMGTQLMTLLKVHPRIRKGILFDRPSVIAQAQAAITTSGLGERCELVGGDFFEGIPEQADAYFMKQIIKDWNDAQCIQLLSTCRKAMKRGGRVLVAEIVLLPGRETSIQKFIDLQLMLLSPGQERTEAQYRKLFEAAGFRLTRIVPTASPYSILEGVPA